MDPNDTKSSPVGDHAPPFGEGSGEAPKPAQSSPVPRRRGGTVPYPPETRARAVALSVATGSTREASKALGIPRRTVSDWMQHPDALPVREAALTTASERFAAIIDAGTTVILERIASPKVRLGEVVQAVDAAFRAASLLSGRPTSRTENVEGVGKVLESISDDDLARLRDWLVRLEGSDGLD